MRIPENVSQMSREEFDAYVLTQCNAASLTCYQGFGKYHTQLFADLEHTSFEKALAEARAAKDEWLRHDPSARLMIYGLVVEPSTTDKGYRIAMQVFVE